MRRRWIGAALIVSPTLAAGCGPIVCADGYAEVYVLGELQDSSTGEPLEGVPLEMDFPESGWHADGETARDGTFLLTGGRMYGGCFPTMLMMRSGGGGGPPPFPEADEPMLLVAYPDDPACRREMNVDPGTMSPTIFDLERLGRELTFDTPFLVDACVDQ